MAVRNHTFHPPKPTVSPPGTYGIGGRKGTWGAAVNIFRACPVGMAAIPWGGGGAAAGAPPRCGRDGAEGAGKSAKRAENGVGRNIFRKFSHPFTLENRKFAADMPSCRSQEAPPRAACPPAEAGQYRSETHDTPSFPRTPRATGVGEVGRAACAAAPRRARLGGKGRPVGVLPEIHVHPPRPSWSGWARTTASGRTSPTRRCSSSPSSPDATTRACRGRRSGRWWRR